MLARPLFSCFSKVYDFAKLQHDRLVQPLCDGIMSELSLRIAMFPLWSAHLRRPRWPVMAATDASGSFGFGISLARCTPSFSRSTAAANSSSDCVVRLQHHQCDPAELPRRGDVYRLPLEIDSFKTVVPIRANNNEAHSGALELEVVRLALLRLTRSRRLHGYRGVVSVDAKVVGSALLKGRSSARTITRACRERGAIQLAVDLKLTFPYLPSESNPAAFPSRNVIKKRRVKQVSLKRGVSSVELMEKHARRVLRRLRQCGRDV